MRPAERLRRRARGERPDPYAGLPTDELDEPVLPRWFVLLALATIPVALVLFLVAFFGFGQEQAPVTERRPPPGDGMTSDVGDIVVGEREPVAHDPACDAVEGFRVAGTELDRSLLGAGLDALCEAPSAVRETVAALAREEPTVRFAAFELTGADVTGAADVVYVNARYSQTASTLIAPLIAYQAELAQGDPAEAETVLAARRAEAAACEAVVDEPGRACEDAEELLELDDPLAALRQAGFQ